MSKLRINVGNICSKYNYQSIKIGMYSKTGGDTKINGYDTDNSMDIVRKSLGICPQHNMLFPELTVEEHFTMFGMVR